MIEKLPAIVALAAMGCGGTAIVAGFAPAVERAAADNPAVSTEAAAERAERQAAGRAFAGETEPDSEMRPL